MKEEAFEKKELERYSRHLLLPEFGRRGQEKLKKSEVLVIGAGALGAPVILYLAAAGVGRIRIVDPDEVADHNLQRQVLFRTEDIGHQKAEVAEKRVKELNPWIEAEGCVEALSSENAMEFLGGADLLIDGSDNFPTRYLANDASVLAGIPNVHASVFRFEGQIAVFNAGQNGEQRTADYRDLFPEPPPPGSVPGCNEGGVLGMLPGIMGSMQANEAVKLLAGTGRPLKGELLIFDALRTELRKVRIPRDPERPPIDRLIDHEAFCGLSKSKEEQDEPPSIEPERLKEMMDEGEAFTLVDVREPGEREIVNIGGRAIPLNRLPEEAGTLKEDRPIILYCRSGQRSGRGVQILRDQMPQAELYNLEGGVLAWIDRVDPEQARY